MNKDRKNFQQLYDSLFDIVFDIAGIGIGGDIGFACCWGSDRSNCLQCQWCRNHRDIEK